jgi:hypothetical protein
MLRSGYVLVKHICAALTCFASTWFSRRMMEHFSPSTKRQCDGMTTLSLLFGTNVSPAILQENNPWTRFLEDPVEEGSAGSSPQQHAVAAREKMEARCEELSEWRRVMERGFELCEKELDNDKFVESFRDLMKPITKAVKECDEALQAQTQQKTWGSKGGKLAFWLR